ncbi:hypothetical protein PEC18_29375 [Paucibacter sp. O1-1]|nr:hypothetical protein [Paucibacter sp. O1-1]MDA3829852.1 hypothetical protein [Paucibacter sp. O1-1]
MKRLTNGVFARRAAACQADRGGRYWLLSCWPEKAALLGAVVPPPEERAETTFAVSRSNVGFAPRSSTFGQTLQIDASEMI